MSFNQCSPTTSVTYLSERLDKLFCFVPHWEWQSESAWQLQLPFSLPLLLFFFFFFFASMRSDRRGAIFGACCAGCFYLAHPSGLVFKPWPSGSGMMRTLFQSPPLKARQSSAWTQKMVSINDDCPHPPPSPPQIKVRFFRPLKPHISLMPKSGCNLYLEISVFYPDVEYCNCNCNSINVTKSIMKI